MTKLLGERAIVIGGSMAGLMAATVLANYFENVTILERDHIDDHPAVHKSIPQGHQLHLLLSGGLQALSRLHPGFTELLIDSGAIPIRVGMDAAIFLPEGKFYSIFEMSGTRLQSYIRPVCRRPDRHLDHDGFPRVSCFGSFKRPLRP